jgi:hypothetical protein
MIGKETGIRRPVLRRKEAASCGLHHQLERGFSRHIPVSETGRKPADRRGGESGPLRRRALFLATASPLYDADGNPAGP